MTASSEGRSWESTMRSVVSVSLLLAIACSSTTPVGPVDSGSFPLQCFEPLDGGVFLAGLPAIAPGCNASADAGVFDLAALGWSLKGGVLVVPPSTPGAPVPVVVVFHGAGSTGESAREAFGLEGPADGGAIFVYPNAARGTWDIRPASTDGRKVDRLLRQLSDSYCIDPRRVFAAGFSAGAVFTLYLGCNVPGTFRAFGVVAGTDDRFDTRCCSGPLSAVLVHGTTDSVIAYGGGMGAFANIAIRDQCRFDSSVKDGTNCTLYPSCGTGRVTEWCSWVGNHEVPTWAGDTLWQFFSTAP